ncbi:hypothetical protein IGI04_023430 [Brassica rapa subsp. trilocularis]|uniref:Uncharacterized protein n=1 Tax=Brassica rapa subsp. trilocularis TaxID=1813537 RepID=A0ABQ7M3T3_BRACM|nr:hypothetical protein IGI04_023430 [Brassica rapa subsp. trilocularis]
MLQAVVLQAEAAVMYPVARVSTNRYVLVSINLYGPVSFGYLVQFVLVNDVPQSDVLNTSTKVHSFDRAGHTNRAVKRINPRASGMELQLELRPGDRTDCTEAHLSRPTRQDKIDGQARINLGRVNSDSDRSFSLLARLARIACTDDRSDDLASLFDPMMDFSFGYFSKARILKLSEDLGHTGTQLVRSERPAALTDRPVALADRPAHVLILTALDTASSDEPGQ